eukprot:jgi/Undpi1/12377/HiC_scaffold_5.g02049.m1
MVLGCGRDRPACPQSPVAGAVPLGATEAASSGEEEEEEWKAPAAAAANSSEGSDEEKPKPTEKKPKEKKAKKAGKKPGDGSGVSNKIELGKKKFVDVREFKGMTLIDIREYYENADGEMKPTKKGISLSPAQWKALRENMDEIDSKIEEIQS